MDLIVFTGPTLLSDEASQIVEATYMPPVKQGDVYRAVHQQPKVIGIIDGYFDQVASVWHKEILWAMAQGIHVVGSSSMGALRAAELVAFGMEGVGEIFAAFRDGRLTDDDEVAVRHGPVDSGYKSLSEAMVNIRSTLSKAEQHKIIESTTKTRLEALAKALEYPNRAYSNILQLGRDEGLPQEQLDALSLWLQHERVDQKRLDALAMLTYVKDELLLDLTPKSVDYLFEHTNMWQSLITSCAATQNNKH